MLIIFLKSIFGSNSSQKKEEAVREIFQVEIVSKRRNIINKKSFYFLDISKLNDSKEFAILNFN